MRSGRLRVDTTGVRRPNLGFLRQSEMELRGSGLDQGAAGGESPAGGRVFRYRGRREWIGLAGALGARPALAGGGAADDDRAGATIGFGWAEFVALRPAPRAQVHK